MLFATRKKDEAKYDTSRRFYHAYGGENSENENRENEIERNEKKKKEKKKKKTEAETS